MTDAPVYLDYAATTPIDDRVLDAMQSCSGFDAHFGNAGSEISVPVCMLLCVLIKKRMMHCWR